MKKLLLGTGQCVVVNQNRQIKISGCEWLVLVKQFLEAEEEYLECHPFDGMRIRWSNNIISNN